MSEVRAILVKGEGRYAPEKDFSYNSAITFSFDLETEPDWAKESENMLWTRDIGRTDVWMDGRMD